MNKYPLRELLEMFGGMFLIGLALAALVSPVLLLAVLIKWMMS